MKIFKVVVECCADCPAFRSEDGFCYFSSQFVDSDLDVLDKVADFYELEASLRP
jgi:hypothetical protein